MHVLILGGGGFIGSQLSEELITKGGLARGRHDRLTLVDVAFPEGRMSDAAIRYVEGDFSDERTMRSILQGQPDVIFHLAAIVSGEAEKNFELGMKINFHAS